MRAYLTAGLALIFLLACFQTWAGAAERTPLGALQEGSAEEQVPTWIGGLKKQIASHLRYADPFYLEQPAFVITASNAANYADRLSRGQRALLQKYPHTYRLAVYPSHRTTAYPPELYRSIKHNGQHTSLADAGNAVQQLQDVIPFPTPQNAEEVIWNHFTRYRGQQLQRTFIQASVERNGSFSAVKFRENYLRSAAEDYPWHFYFTQEILAPSRLTGQIILVHESLDKRRSPRKAWIYSSGQRRVRRAPTIAYDAPGTASDGLRTSDNLEMYNGALDRYDWQLHGQQVLYVPYNSYRLADRQLRYKDIIQAGHLNPELLRYEPHRVWKVEGSLKDGASHIYSRRVFYIDEDSWQILLAEHYDNRGELWRVSEAYPLMFADVTVPGMAAEVIYDLQSGRYLVNGLTNEEGLGYRFDTDLTERDFTPKALRRMGR